MYRKEHDSLGEVLVEDERYWGAQTQRSLRNFVIGTETMPAEVIRAFALLKKAAAQANTGLSVLEEEKCGLICAVCDEILAGKLDGEFPLRVWQTGSGTQTNMNLNEVIAHRGNQLAGREALHPNDDVNRSQSSNDTFPTAMRIAAVQAVEEGLLPALDSLAAAFHRLENEYPSVITVGRTHLQDAVPIRFSQEVSGWRTMLHKDRGMLTAGLKDLCELPLGGTAVGTGLNAPKEFDTLSAEKLVALTGLPFVTAENKFHALTSLDAFVGEHGAMKALAADLMKIANDIRWLSSGPRCGIGELTIPANEPGSSIMPGKINPTQCEAVTMVAVQVMGNDTAVGIAASQGNFQLNVFLPVTIYNFLQSARLLADAMRSFEKNCVRGIVPNEERMAENLRRSLMNVTALNPRIGYENAAKVANYAFAKDCTLAEAAEALDFLSREEAEEALDPKKMV
jgi:fumarate hydratase class II